MINIEQGFLISNEEVIKLDNYSMKNFKSEKETLEREVKKIFEEDEILDGDKLQKLFFPVDRYDFFISYSHDDEVLGERLANYLIAKGFKVFLDSKIWGSADFLLKLIDNKYCFDETTGLYDYSKRNFSTAHVHSLLNAAIGEAINKSDNIIFMSMNEPKMKEKNNLETRILSPWIYQELNYFNLFYYNQHNHKIYTEGKTSRYIIKNMLQISRKGDIKNLRRITAESLKLFVHRHNYLGYQYE